MIFRKSGPRTTGKGDPRGIETPWQQPSSRHAHNHTQPKQYNLPIRYGFYLYGQIFNLLKTKMRFAAYGPL